MDAFGFVFASAFLATAFTIFGVIGRILGVVAGEVRYTIAPTMVDGVRAWNSELGEARRARLAGAAPADEGDPGTPDGGPDVDTATDRRDPGAVFPVQALPDRGWHLFGRLLHGLVVGRRAPLAHG
jgi:hypothetical protein